MSRLVGFLPPNVSLTPLFNGLITARVQLHQPYEDDDIIAIYINTIGDGSETKEYIQRPLVPNLKVNTVNIICVSTMALEYCMWPETANRTRYHNFIRSNRFRLDTEQSIFIVDDAFVKWNDTRRSRREVNERKIDVVTEKE